MLESPISYEIKILKQFKKDYKLCERRGLDITLLDKVMQSLVYKNALETKYKDHSLIGNYKDCRECHIKPDWLLVYEIFEYKNIILFHRTGTHSDLF